MPYSAIMAAEHSTHDLAEMLRWQMAAGATAAVSETAIDRFAQSAAASRPRKEAPPQQAVADQERQGSGRPAAPSAPAAKAEASDGTDPEAARRIAQSCGDLDELRAAMEAFEGCPLKLRATQLVFADGNPQADIMLIGEAPGRDEDEQGKPFVGRAGRLLDRMLAAIGFDRNSVYIANTVPWRPPGNRNPTPMEVAACMPFLNRQVELVAPKLVMGLGKVAVGTLYGEEVPITRVRGKWRDVEFGALTLPVLASFHPAFLLRQPRQKREAWKDLLTLKSAHDTMDRGRAG